MSASWECSGWRWFAFTFLIFAQTKQTPSEPMSTVQNCSIKHRASERERKPANPGNACILLYTMLFPTPCSFWLRSKALTVKKKLKYWTELWIECTTQDCYHVQTTHNVVCYVLQSCVTCSVCSAVYTFTILFIQILAYCFTVCMPFICVYIDSMAIKVYF